MNKSDIDTIRGLYEQYEAADEHEEFPLMRGLAHMIPALLAYIDALEAQLATWEDDTPPASQPKAEYPVSVTISSVERGTPSGLLQSETDEAAYIEALEAVADAAAAVSAAFHDEHIDRYGREIIYVKMGTTEYGLDRESTNKMAMALFALRDALKGAGK